jgi:hypothetical protein
MDRPLCGGAVPADRIAASAGSCMSRGRVIGGCNRPRTTYDSMRPVSNPLTSRCSPSWRWRGGSEPSPRTPPDCPASGGPFCSSGDPAKADKSRPCRALPR